MILSKKRITIKKNKGADQSAQMHRLICDFVFPKPGRQVFLRRGLIMFCFLCIHLAGDIKSLKLLVSQQSHTTFDYISKF